MRPQPMPGFAALEETRLIEACERRLPYQ